MEPNYRKTAYAVFVICAAMAIAAQAQTFTTLATFDGANGANPFFMSLAQGTDGKFYGTTFLGGSGAGCVWGNGSSGCGTVFKISRKGRLKVLYSFCSQTNCTDGQIPIAGLVQGNDGNFYGTTQGGGPYGYHGTVFKITHSGRLTTLYSFCPKGDYCTDGQIPIAGLVQASDGNFYGTTYDGGANRDGTVFKITPKGVLTALYSFCAQLYCSDGYYPQAALVQATDGNFYGTTYLGGTNDSGTVFKITLGSSLTTVHSFNIADGYTPQGAALIQATDGNFYGTTPQGGTSHFPLSPGTVFRMTPAGKLTTLHSFCAQANCADGSYPYAPLVQATDGNFYGTTSDSQGYGYGTIFKITPKGVLTTLYSFCAQPDCADGSGPYGGLVQATDGKFYGTTFYGGSSGNCGLSPGLGCGTVFSLDVGLGPFVTFVRAAGKVGQTSGILGQGFTGTTSVAINGVPATFKVVSDTFIKATVPTGATTGYVTVTTQSGALKSNVPFQVIP